MSSKVIALNQESGINREKIRSMLESCRPITKEQAKVLREIIAVFKEELALDNQEIKGLLGSMVKIEIG